MFELGKKDGSDKNDGNIARTSQNEGWSGAKSAPAPASSAPVRGEVAVIGRSIRINGDLQGEEDLRIEGDVNGTVRLYNNTLTIGSEGKIRADVYAKAVVVDGLMEGDLYGSERVAVRNNATVLGNITAPRVSLDDGAKFKGSIEMDSEAVKAAIGATSKTAPAATKAQPKQTGEQRSAKQTPAARQDPPARESVG